MHFEYLFLGGGDLVPEVVGLFGSGGLFDVGEDIDSGFAGLYAFFLVDVFKRLVVDIASEIRLTPIHLNKIIEL